MAGEPRVLANIGQRERRVRRWLGMVALVIGTVGTGALMAADTAPAWWWGIVFFALYYQGVRFVLDAQTGTCPLKAELGQRNLDGVVTILGEPIDDSELVRAIRAVSRRAIVFSLASAAMLTVLSMWLAAT